MTDRKATAQGPEPEGYVARAALMLIRGAVRGASLVAPQLVARKAADLMSSPRRLAGPRLDGASACLRLPFGNETLAAWIEGPADGRLVLFVHGWEADSRQLDPLVEPVCRAGFRVARFDQPAHGLSSGKRASVIDFRDAVASVAARLGPLFAIVGHSLGATAATLALARGLRAERMVLIAPAREPGIFVARIAHTLGLAAAERAALYELVARDIGRFEDLDIAARAADRREPALIVHAQNDRMIPFDEGAAIASAWPDAQLLAPASLGHRRILKDPVVVQATVDFLTRASAERAWTLRSATRA